MSRRLTISAFLACIIALVPLAHAGSQNASEPLIGIWEYQTVFLPLHGTLTVIRNKSQWRASIGGARAVAPATDHTVRFGFANGAGKFRGEVRAAGRLIDGFWIQPAAAPNNALDPGPTQPFASPLTLARISPNRWRAVVRPLPHSFTLYLRIFRNSNGLLTAAFRDPEQNSNGRAAQFAVAQTGNVLTFSARRAGRPDTILTATLAADGQHLQMTWPDLGSTITLSKRKESTATNFFPRAPGFRYSYSQPPQIGDGWSTERATSAGFDENALMNLVQGIINTDPSAARAPLIHSLLIARHGKLVLEEYFFGYDRAQPHDLRSAGKTFASVMMGALMARGASLTPQSRVYSILSGMGPFANPDPRKAQITVGELLTHTSGLACDDNDDNSPGNEGTMQAQKRQPNWWKYTLDLPVAHDPGSRYAYCSAGTNLSGAVLTTVSRTWLPALFAQTIARPLQFGPYYWNLMPTDEGYLGGGAYVRPRDLLKVGQMYLDGGTWHGKRIVDSSWVNDSTAEHVKITPATTGLTADQFPEYYIEGADGYAWHLSELHSKDRTYKAYQATGNGGQLLIVVPELDLTVVFTAGNYGQGYVWIPFTSVMLPQQIIPALTK